MKNGWQRTTRKIYNWQKYRCIHISRDLAILCCGIPITTHSPWFIQPATTYYSHIVECTQNMCSIHISFFLGILNTNKSLFVAYKLSQIEVRKYFLFCNVCWFFCCLAFSLIGSIFAYCSWIGYWIISVYPSLRPMGSCLIITWR